MNPKLKAVKENLKKIDRFCTSHPSPSDMDLNMFIQQNELNMFQNYADSFLAAVREKEWLLYQNKINKSRV